jgi:hypothetical protein
MQAECTVSQGSTEPVSVALPVGRGLGEASIISAALLKSLI